MKKKQDIKEYLKKTFIQYAMVLFFAMAFLVIVFFALNYYISVVRQNEISNATFTSLFRKEYQRYQESAESFAKQKELINTTKQTSTTDRTKMGEDLYTFANSGDIKSYFVVTDVNDEVLLSNLTKGNQTTFKESLFYHRAKSLLINRSDSVLGMICDVELVNDQSIMYSFVKAIKDENNQISGYLFLNMRNNDVFDYVQSLNEEVLILDRYQNAIFSSFALPKDPGDKLPARRFTINIDHNGIYRISNTRMYIRSSQIQEEEIEIVTLTSIERMVQTWRMAGVFFALVLTALGILSFLMARLYTRINERGVRDLMRDLEVKNLEERFKPHFVYNVMESVRFQIDEDPKKAKNMLLAFASLMRYSINYGHSKVRLETDIDYLNDFLMLQKIRYNQLLSYDFHIPDELLDCLIPKLLLQPIIENSIRHGFVKGQQLHIDIKAEHVGDELIFTVQDNGKGIPEEELQEIKERFKEEVSDDTVKHIGLYNVEKVLSMLYGEGYGLKIDSTINVGTTVVLRMPYEIEEEDV